MTSVVVRDLKGKEQGSKELNADVFGAEINSHLIHQALVRQLANARSGSANTKTRSEVRGGGRKPWRQKGTGRARAGSTRSPLWNGGGVTFGPKPRDFSITMNKKARQLALKSALAARAEELVVVQNFDGLFKQAPKAGEAVNEQPKTKEVLSILKSLNIADKNVLIVLDRMVAGSKQVERAARNIPNVKVVDQTNLNVKDLAHAGAVLTTEQVLNELENRFKNCGSKASCEQSAAEKNGAAKAAGTKSGAATAKKAAAPKAEAEPKAKAKADAPAAEKKASTKKAAPEPKADEAKAPKKTSKKKSDEA